MKWTVAALCLLSLSGTAQTFYDTGKIQRIEIFFSQNNWDLMLDTSKSGADGYVMASAVYVNGIKFDSAGVKYKGNSSYDSSFKKNPIHIELNTYKDQHYEGFTDIKLGNGYADPSMIREVLGYRILSDYLPCSASNFAKLYINGKYIGLYSNSESVNKDYCEKRYYSGTGTFIKCNPLLTPAVNVKSNLFYFSGDSTAFYNYYELKSGYGWDHLLSLCNVLKNQPDSIHTVINVDRVLWMLAFNTLFVNLDSYNGAFAQNYYLYRGPDKVFNPIVWDLNMSFGGFPFLGSANTSLASLSIAGMQNLSAFHHANDNYWPLIKAVNNNTSLKKKFIAHLKTITNDWITSGKYIQQYNIYKSLIDSAVLADNNKFFSYSDLQNSLSSNIAVGSYSVPGIQTLMSGRQSFLNSTAEFLSTAPVINSVTSVPATLHQSLTINANITDAGTAQLHYRFVQANGFSALPMFDDGNHNDGSAGDKLFGCTLVMKGNELQYYIYAENEQSGKFSPERAEKEFHTLNLYQPAKAGDIVINEILAENKSDVRNEYHISEDWIELFNNSSSKLSLDNIYLSDDGNEKIKFRFPAGTVIDAYGFLPVWADEFPAKTQLHAGFKLDEDGEKLLLGNGLNSYDVVELGPQAKDVSYARCPDGYGNFDFSERPSFGLANCVTGLFEDLVPGQMKVYPNPASDSFTITGDGANYTTIRIFNITGQVLYQQQFSQNMRCNTLSWPPGVYFVSNGSQTSKLIINH
jgi:hypothetical protein